MTSDLESSASTGTDLETKAARREDAPHGWLKVGAVAAASAVLGGLAAAWFYRKTLAQLREAESAIPDPKSGITGDGSAEDF
jgi:hypothetical protein